MRMNFGEVLTIEDLGNHSAATVIELGILLAGTMDVTPDSKRKGFYEVENGSTVYYIHVAPVIHLNRPDCAYQVERQCDVEQQEHCRIHVVCRLPGE